eukprot:COSAG06_NODE_30229_length_542_cov_1.370203_1_plen_34_part_10
MFEECSRNCPLPLLPLLSLIAVLQAAAPALRAIA